MTNRYKVDTEKALEGLRGIIELKINNLETLMEGSNNLTILEAYKETLDAINLARTTSIEVLPYVEVLENLVPQLKEYGILI